VITIGFYHARGAKATAEKGEGRREKVQRKGAKRQRGKEAKKDLSQGL
jgi:hypothetical protein